MRSLYSSVASETLGVGVGLRAPHVAQILQELPSMDWFELLADNHIAAGGWSRRQAIEIAQHYAVSMHCVGMSIGSCDPINFDYLKKIKQLANEVQAKLISEHLCWTTWSSQNSHDLLPLPFTEEALAHVVYRVNRIQEYLGRRIAIENVSSYLTFKHSTIDEVEFINAVAQRADCLILLDINNLYVNHVNNNQQAYLYLDQVDVTRIAELHLAGFENKEQYLLDAHNNKVHANVWVLYEYFLRRKMDVPTLIEWDHNIPAFEVLYGEAMKACQVRQQLQCESEPVYAAS